MGFQYEPLAYNEIRLIKPVENSSNELCYEITHVALSSKPQYAALSYVWGPPGDTHHIHISGQFFPVRENLYKALRQLRDSKRIEKYLWVDALCVNQGTDRAALHERSTQIILMKEIYEQAKNVFVWLGEPENETNNRLAVRKMKYFWKLFFKGFRKGRPFRPWWWPKKPANHGEDMAKALLFMQPAKNKAVLDVPGSDTYRAWVGIISLWKARWWTRAWVFQEATIPENYKVISVNGIMFTQSTKVKFLCGDQKATWNYFFAAFFAAKAILSTPEVDSKFLEGATQQYEKLTRLREMRIQHVQGSMLGLMQMFRHTECADPRDKVYAPLCLAPEDVRRFIQPDYGNKTVFDVYTSVARYCLGQPGHNLDFLGYAKLQNRANSTTRSTLPSWVPDFAASVQITPIPKSLHVPERVENLEKRHFNYIHNSLPMNNGAVVAAYRPLGDIPCRASIHHRELHVNAVYIDILKDFIPDTGPDVEAARAVAREKGARWAADCGNTYHTGEKWADTVNRTIALDLVYDSLGRPSERGGKIDGEFLKKPRSELSHTDYRYQMNMRTARVASMGSRMLGFSHKKYVLVIPDTAEPGDSIWALSGGQALYILRRTNPYLKEYTFVGECYAHGLMDGEIVRMLHTGELRMEYISLV